MDTGDAVHSGCSRIVVYGGGDIVFDTRRSNQHLLHRFSVTDIITSKISHAICGQYLNRLGNPYNIFETVATALSEEICLH